MGIKENIPPVMQLHAAGAHIIGRSLLLPYGLHLHSHHACGDTADGKAHHHGNGNCLAVVLFDRNISGHFFTGQFLPRNAVGIGLGCQLREQGKGFVVLSVTEVRNQSITHILGGAVGDPVVTLAVCEDVPLPFRQTHKVENTVFRIALLIIDHSGAFFRGHTVEAVDRVKDGGKTVFLGIKLVDILQVGPILGIQKFFLVLDKLGGQLIAFLA